MKYESGPYDELKDGIQYIRIGDGCHNQCEFCYAPKEYKYHGIPEIRAKYVKILDMNLLSYPNAIDIMIELPKKFNGQKVHYELVCGIDYRFFFNLDPIIMKRNGFIKPRFAWDGGIQLQYKMKDCWKKLLKVGYDNISCFVIANWKVPYEDCLFKLDLLKIWNVKVCDTYYDGQVSPHVKPIYWTEKQIKDFRARCRKHNQMVLFKIDPEMNRKTKLTDHRMQKSISSLK